MKNKLLIWTIKIIFLFLLLILVSTFSLFIGSSNIPTNKILSILGKKDSIEYSIIFDIRLPRILLGFAVGGALSIAGVILQAMFRNPLVEPYTLGISGGAGLGVCLNIVLHLNKIGGVFSIPLSGFLGAIAAILIVYSLSLKKKIIKIQNFLLIGVMISFISSSIMMLLMAVSRVEDLHGIIYWIMGSLDEPNWLLIHSMIFVSIFGLFSSYFLWTDLNTIIIGEEEAIHLGINVERTKKILFLISSLITGCAVATCGIIGFVGLVVPHITRKIVGYDHRILLISSFLIGASFLILSDTVARTIISPLELPVGVITGIVGGIIFIYFLNKKGY